MFSHICLQVLGTRLAVGTECAAIITARSRAVYLKLAEGARGLSVDACAGTSLLGAGRSKLRHSDKCHFRGAWMSRSLSKQRIPQLPSRTCKSFGASRN